MSRVLTRGLLVGLFATLVGFLVAKTIGETQVGAAIGIEGAKAAAAHAPEEAELVSRNVQSTLGLLTGLTMFSVALGGIYSLVFATVQGRLGSLNARMTALVVGALGFLGFYVLPFLKYPPNPPAVGNPDTIGHRTRLYFAIMIISLAAVIASALLAHALWRNRGMGAWEAVLSGGALGLVVMVITYVLMPNYNEIPGDFPANIIWHFRMDSLLLQGSLWLTISLVFGWVTQRELVGASKRAGWSAVLAKA